MLKSPIFRSKLVAVCWFIFMTSLFFIKAPEFPERKWIHVFQPDKLAHIVFFAIQIFLWRSAFNMESRNYNLFLFISISLYGLMIEILQGLLVPNRNFDLFDLLADMLGAYLGLLVWARVYKKNKPL